MLGYDYAFAFDDIGNRMTTTVNSHASTYTLDTTKLNQYTQRTVPGFVDVFGSAKPGAFVTANYQSMTRQGGGFYTGLAVTNTTTPQYLSVSVVGVKNNAGPNGEDAVSADTRTAFVPQIPEAFTYDTDGNLLTDGRWTCTWDAENRLVSMVTNAAAATAGAPQQKLEFVYDARGRRIQKKVSNWNGSAYVLASDTRFLYDGWNMIAELDALNGNAVVRSYVWGLDLSGSPQGAGLPAIASATAGGVGGLLAVNVTTGSATHYPAYDGNGNIIALVSAADGSQSADYEYGPFGDTIKALGPAAALNPFTFSTKYADAETGLVYYGLRYYNPSTGRWLSRDPIEEQGGVNLYGFVSNDPVDNWDDLGLLLLVDSDFEPGSAIGARWQWGVREYNVPAWTGGPNDSSSLPLYDLTFTIERCHCLLGKITLKQQIYRNAVELASFLQRADRTWPYFYGHEQLHVASLLAEFRHIRTLMEREKECFDSDSEAEAAASRYSSKYLEMMRQVVLNEKAHHGNNGTPAAGTTYPPLSPPPGSPAPGGWVPSSNSATP